MDYLARKINSSRWEPTPYTGPEDVRADAITVCLKSTDDSLSFWHCNAELEDLSEVVLAYASTLKTIEGLHFVLLEKNDLDINGFTVKSDPEGTMTPIENLRRRHVSLINLTMTQLCFIARRIAIKVRQNSHLYLFTRENVLDILFDAIKKDRVQLNSLKDGVKNELHKRLRG